MNKRKIWIAAAAVLLAGAVIAAMAIPGRKSGPAAVYPVNMISYTGASGSAGESYGMVTADKVQSIYVSDTQTVTRVYVREGDVVKKGDLLYAYDTTLTDLALERKDLSIQQMELNLKTAQEDLKKLKAMQPMVVTTPNVAEKGKAPADTALLGTRYGGRGIATDPFLFWMCSGASVSQEFIWEQFLSGKDPGTKVYVIFQSTPADQPNVEFNNEFGLIFSIPFLVPEEVPEGTEATTPGTETPPETETEPGTEPGTTQSAPAPGYNYNISFFDPNSENSGTQIDWNSGYTQSELNTMRDEKAEEIKTLEFNIKIGKAELEIMKKEASDGNVYAAFDGVVVHVMSPDDAQSLQEPMLKVTGGGGYYVEGSVSELELGNIQVGQKVKVYCWDNGDEYTGTVSSIGTYPSEDSELSGGGVNVTYYPYTVFVEDSADLQEGAYVSLTYYAGGAEDVLYLENAFLLTEGRDSYVYVRNEAGVLEKRQIQTGISTDGYATPVYAGLGMDDYIAFPYDKNVREGANTVESGLDELYGY